MAKRTKRILETSEPGEEVRLNKFIADAGICSRRKADEFIEQGKVTVDGVKALMGTKVRKGQKVCVNGKPIQRDEKLVLIAFHKPRGIVCTTDRKEPDNVIDFIQYGSRIYPIGRLDKDSEGLLLLTNDGDIVNKILRAGNQHEKEYIVTVNKKITPEFLSKMAGGVPILDTTTLPCFVEEINKTTFRIILKQGLNRQIRRMCEYLGYQVLALQRIRIMNIRLGRLKVGDYRNVTLDELVSLKDMLKDSNSSSDYGDD
jgi:23S rRNA pseudouridine2604 synthase